MKKILFILLFVRILLPAGAQEDTTTCKYHRPLLGGHTFQFSNTAKGPFIKTYLDGSIGLGNTGTMIMPGVHVGDTEIFSFTGEIMFFNAGLQYQQRVNDWLAFYVSYDLVGRVGSDVSTLLVDGMNSLSGGSLGWLFKLYRSENFMLSGTLMLQNLSGSFIDVVGYINDLMDSVSNPEVSRRVPVMNGGAGFSGAWTLNPTVGLIFEGIFMYGESFVRGARSFNYALKAGGDIDLNPKYHVPVGLSVGYAFSSMPENTLLEFSHTNLFHLRLGYTGSCDFDVGLQFTFYRFELNNIEKRRPWVKNTELAFRLYF